MKAVVMSTVLNRFEVKQDGNKFRVLDRRTDKEVTPDCGQDMADLIAYYRGVGKFEEIYYLLEDIIDGKRPISAMRSTAGNSP